MPLDSAGNTTPDYAGQVSQLQQGLAATQNAAPAAPPQYQAPADPVTQTFFGKLLTGALQGLAGGTRSAMINEAGRGTPGFKPDSSGADYAGMLQKQQNDQDLQNQEQAKQAAQQKFTNDSETYRNQQAAVAQKAQAYQAQINALHTAQAMQYATADQQRAYLKGESDKADHLGEQGVPVLGTFSDSSGGDATDKLAQWMQQNHKEISDFTQVHSKGPKGEDIITVYDNPNHQVDADQTNKELTAMGSARRVTGSMSYSDKHALVMGEGAKLADQVYAKQQEDHKAQLQLHNEQVLEGQRSADAQKLEAQKETAKGQLANGTMDFTQPLTQPGLESKVDDLHDGSATVAQATKGMGKDATVNNTMMEARYRAKYLTPGSPDYDANAPKWSEIDGQHKDAYSVQTSNLIHAIGELADGTDPKTGERQPGAITLAQNKLLNLADKHPAWFSTGPTARLAATIGDFAGDPDVQDIKKNAPDIALAYARVASGGGPSSEAIYNDTVASIREASTGAAMRQVFEGMDGTLSTRINGLAKRGNYFINQRMKNITNPGTASDPLSQRAGTAASGGNQSGAGQKIPSGMKQQRNKTTGAIRLVPE
jgi:hypothetical protein